ncbi:MAG: HEAT repeat domain-containing protein [Acidobacteriota bacterium]
MDYRVLIKHLAIPHRAGTAFWQLMSAGQDVLPAVRLGLRHTNSDVRYYCCSILDRYLSPDTIDDLIGMLGDPDIRVRCAALHALACDRCKEGECRPQASAVLPISVRLLANDPSPHVRAMAVEVVGQWVHINDLAENALVVSRNTDPSPMVRKKAGWYAPGGTIYARTAAKARASSS